MLSAQYRIRSKVLSIRAEDNIQYCNIQLVLFWYAELLIYDPLRMWTWWCKALNMKLKSEFFDNYNSNVKYYILWYMNVYFWCVKWKYSTIVIVHDRHCEPVYCRGTIACKQHNLMLFQDIQFNHSFERNKFT